MARASSDHPKASKLRRRCKKLRAERLRYSSGPRRKIGAGSSRNVYLYQAWPHLAVKEPNLAKPHITIYENLREWYIWNHAPPEIRHFLLPVISLSDCCHFLLMPLARKLQPPYEVPASYPKPFSGDAKPANWVMYQSQILLCDYGCQVSFKKIFHARVEDLI